MKKILTEIKNTVLDDAIKFRRHIHQYPEISFKEFKTAEYIRAELEKMGIQWSECTETGTIAILGQGEKCIGLRADIDALPIEEKTNLSYASSNKGIMHACGHDIHTASLLATAKYLKLNEDELKVKVKLIFQPAEEMQPGGALKMLEAGVLNSPDVSEIFGLHIFPELNTGKIAMSSGPVMASTDELYFTIKGKSSHAAQPQLGADPILASTQIIQYFQSIINKFRNPITPAVLSIASISGESAINIFPDEVKLKGILRTYDNELRNKIIDVINEKVPLIAKLYNCEIEINIISGYPTLINNVDSIDYAKKITQNILGVDNVVDFEPKMWGEDFARYTQKIPGAFVFVGVVPNNKNALPPLHNSKLSPDEEAILYAISVYVGLALGYDS